MGRCDGNQAEGYERDEKHDGDACTRKMMIKATIVVAAGGRQGGRSWSVEGG